MGKSEENLDTRGKLTKQIRIPLLGELRQLVGGAMTWFTFGTFSFAGLAAWDSSIMLILRGYVPWMNFNIACCMLLAIGLLAVWTEHKFTQPSVMVYWLRMFWEQKNPMRIFLQKKLKAIEDRQTNIEKLLKELIEKNGS